MHRKIYASLECSLKMILVKSADVKAKSMSDQKQVL